MSENPPPKKARVARGNKSDGKYLRAHGPTNKFQAWWLEHPAPEGQPRCKDWLSDGGVDGKNWFQVHCSICPAIFQCKIQNIASHEISKVHKDKAAASPGRLARAVEQGCRLYSSSACSTGSRPQAAHPVCLRVQDAAAGAPHHSSHFGVAQC